MTPAGVPPSPQLTPADRERALWDLTRPDGFFATQVARLDRAPCHGNRRLKLGQLFGAVLLSFFDPITRSLRAVEDRGDFGGLLDLPRLARSTTSDALAALDPSLLNGAIRELLARVPHLRHCDADLAGITRQLVAADGTYFTVVGDAAWALRHTKRDGRPQAQVRANVQVDAQTWVPQVVSVSGGGDDGESEPDAVARDLRSGVLYVVDRNFVDFDFLKAVLARDNDVVLRVKANAPSARVTERLGLTPADRGAGVVADERVELTGTGAPAGAFRVVTVRATNRGGEPETIRLLTSLTDATAVAARVVGEVYRRRWQVELFFKWLKTFARMDHLLSASRNGVTLQLYVAVIGVLLMYAQGGRRVSVYALHQFALLARGQTTLDRALATIAMRDRERAGERERLARKRAAETRG